LKTGAGNFGVTEGELLILGAILISGVISPNFYITPFYDVFVNFGWVNPATAPAWIKLYFNFDLKDFIMKPLYVGIAYVIIYNAWTIIPTSKNRTKAFAQFIPLVIIMASTILWSTLPVFETHAASILLICGLLYSLNTSRIIVCSLTKMDHPMIQLECLVNIAAVCLI